MIIKTIDLCSNFTAVNRAGKKSNLAHTYLTNYKDMQFKTPTQKASVLFKTSCHKFKVDNFACTDLCYVQHVVSQKKQNEIHDLSQKILIN